MACDAVVVVWSRVLPVAAVLGALDSVETDRLAAFRHAGDRARFATGCWLVRSMAATASGAAMDEIEIDRRCPRCDAFHGRPRLRSDALLAVSVTHAGDRVGVAVGRGAHPIGDNGDGLGIDVSVSTERTGVMDLAEARGWQESWPRTVDDHFRLWVYKEAVLKAAGVGLTVDPFGLVVGRAPDGGHFIESWPLEHPAEGVHLVPLDPGEDEIGGLAWAGAKDPIVQQIWWVPEGSGP